jgi:hypothetical protein
MSLQQDSGGFFYNNCFFAQILTAFLIGVLTSPWSWGIVFFLLFLLAMELLTLYQLGINSPFWRIEVRLAVIVASVLGFLFGRALVGFSNLFE